jgi:hypothetical protein
MQSLPHAPGSGLHQSALGCKKSTVGAVIKVGISSWTEPTLIASGWYPRQARDVEARLRYYSSRFSLVEVDSPLGQARGVK